MSETIAAASDGETGAALDAAPAQTPPATEIPRTAETEPDYVPAGLAEFKWPWLTFALLGIVVLIFALENALSAAPSPLARSNITALLAFGGLNPVAVFSDGEWYRLFTAPLLHINTVHITANAIALLLGGWSALSDDCGSLRSWSPARWADRSHRLRRCRRS